MHQIILLGDSTCAVKDDEVRPETGWGEAFVQYVRDGWKVENFAVNGRSTKDAISLGIFARALETAQPGDLVLIQYGHNDEKLDDPARGTDPWHQYIVNLCYMAGKMKEKGARVIFLTSIARRRFSGGELTDSHGDWPAAMKAAAAEAGVDCIDLTIPTMLGIVKAGEEESKKYYMHFDAGLYENYPNGDEDDTHLRPEGAEWVAKMVYDKLSALPDKPEGIK